MDNEGERSSNNSGQSISSSVNQPQSQTGAHRGNKWHALAIIATVILIVSVLSVGVYLGLSKRRFAPQAKNIGEPPQSTIPVTLTPLTDEPTASAAPTVAEEIPSLFPGLTIKQRQEGIVFKTEDLDGPVQIQGTKVEGNIRSLEDARLALELVGYYNNYFTTRGWDFYLSASGPLGDLEGWKKDGKYFIMEYRVDVHTGKKSVFIRYN